jgi:NADPH:quinone reductase-like Zn-dependent oxidoreductase
LRNVAILGPAVRELMPGNDSVGRFELRGRPVDCGIVPTRGPDFDPAAPENRRSVLVRVRAFSCNFRDMNFILTASRKAGRSFYVVGSDFAGEVVAAGPGVRGLAPGDRVMGDCHYTGGPARGAPEGVPTNHGSREYQVFHEEQLMRIPEGMPDEVAAAFTIGAQTSYSMVRRLELAEGAHVLVTAARSNTSLFVINALRRRGARVYATTTSVAAAGRLKELGVREVFVVGRSGGESLRRDVRVRAVADEAGGFAAVVDPFFDLHLDRVLDVMAPGGRYITCGLHAQHRDLLEGDAGPRELDFRALMIKAMVKNIQIVGNCIGLTEDLREAAADYAGGSLGVAVDSVFTGNRVADFFHRTYCADDRFGKVVYRYE